VQKRVETWIGHGSRKPTKKGPRDWMHLWRNIKAAVPDGERVRRRETVLGGKKKLRMTNRQPTGEGFKSSCERRRGVTRGGEGGTRNQNLKRKEKTLTKAREMANQKGLKIVKELAFSSIRRREPDVSPDLKGKKKSHQGKRNQKKTKNRKKPPYHSKIT